MSEQQIAVAPPSASAVWQRREFLFKTYGHLLGAIVAFVVLELLYFATGIAETLAGALLSVPWLVVLGGFIVVGFVARNFAASPRSRGMQYAGLGGYVVAESIIFIPLLYVANSLAPGVITTAATFTIIAFVGLTVIAFTSGQDFTLLGGILRWGGVLALLAIVGSLLFGFSLGGLFCLAMVGLAGVAILYDTSKALHTYHDDAYVGASLELFASVALMFWYVLSFLSRR